MHDWVVNMAVFSSSIEEHVGFGSVSRVSRHITFTKFDGHDELCIIGYKLNENEVHIFRWDTMWGSYKGPYTG